MSELLSNSAFFPILLTLGVFLLGNALQKRFHSPLLNPILIAALLVILFLRLSGLSNAAYQEGMRPLSFLMTPATICLAIYFHEQFPRVRRHLPAILAGAAAGTAASLASVFLLSRAFGLDALLTLSLLPKSVTTAIGAVLSQEAGGIPAITTVAIILTGILGNVLGPWLCRLFRLRDPVAQGVALGTASHVIGTARAAEMNEVTKAVSSISLVLSGLMTVLFFPWLLKLL